MAIKKLWAPWRMEFIREKKSDKKRCVFCAALKSSDDRENLILHRAKHSFVILNKYPYNNGHLMVVPNRHTAQWESLAAETSREVMRLTQEAVVALKKVHNPQGFNMGMNLGAAAGAGILDHLHFHIVPRWTGDTNFMPVLSETRCMPQHLMATYDELFNAFA